MSYEFHYTYAREVVEIIDAGEDDPKTCYNIDNKNRRTPQGENLFLIKEISAVFADRECNINCSNTQADISFSVELTTEQKTTLDGIVAAHKAGGVGA